MSRLRVSLCAALFLLPTLAGAQDVLFDDIFNEDPFDLGDWVANGAAVFIPPESDVCTVGGAIEPNTPDNMPCLLYDEDQLDELGEDPEDFGYILVTPGQGSQAGNAFRAEKDNYDNFKMEVIVELRDGSVGRPADGMCIVVVGGEEPPALTGFGGGGMGAPCVGNDPSSSIMVFEFDNWDCNASDGPARPGDRPHLGFAYGPRGIPCTDDVPTIAPNGVAVNLGTSRGQPGHETFHNEDAPDGITHVKPNRNKLTVFAQRCGPTLTVAADLVSMDQFDDDGNPLPPLNHGRVFTHVIREFTPFEGYLGVTASTGGAQQNHILHKAKLESLPDDFCLQPAAGALRIVNSQFSDPAFSFGDFDDGATLTIDVVLDNVRENSTCCDAPEGIIVTDTVPDEWEITGANNGGEILDGGSSVSWTVTGDALANGTVLSYDVLTTDDGVNSFYYFSGNVVESVAGSIPTLIGGDGSARINSPFDDCGGITGWNILGPYGNAGGAAPGEELMRADFLTDGDENTELDFVWFPGAVVNTDFNGASAATGLVPTARELNPAGVPTVFAWNDEGGVINLNDDVFGADPNNAMAYTQIYVDNTSGDDMENLILGISSDDAVQVLINGEEVHINNIARGASDACFPQDIAPDNINRFDPITLEAGENSIIIKTFEGGGGFGMAFVIQDEFGLPVTEDLVLSKFPPGVCPFTPVAGTRSIDTGATVQVQGIEVPSYDLETDYSVSIALTDIREASDACDGASDVRIVETVPEGWAVSNVGQGGVLVGQAITWTLSAGDNLAEGSLTYDVTSGSVAEDVFFFGEIVEPGSILSFGVGGDGNLSNPVDFTPQGFLRKWLLLGPYAQPAGFGWGAAPFDANMQEDWITDGDEIESEHQPEPGTQIDTDFSLSPSGRLAAAGQSPPSPINPDDVPTWAAWVDNDDTINFDHYYGGNIDQIMMVSTVYVNFEDDMTLDIGLASDDSVQVLLDGEEIHILSVARGDGGANVIQDVIFAQSFSAGLHQIMVKVFEGGGGHTMRMRFQDELGDPVTEGISLCFFPDPEACGAPPPTGGGFVRGDPSSNGVVELTDGILVLNFLFLGGAAPSCMDSGDVDDDGSLAISDAVGVFSYLFLGGVPPRDPGPLSTVYTADECGPDPTDDALDCATPGPVCQ